MSPCLCVCACVFTSDVGWGLVVGLYLSTSLK